MEHIDINHLAEYISGNAMKVEGVYYYTQELGVPHANYTDKYPGFVFPLKGSTKFQFEDMPYVFTPGKIVHGGPHMKLAYDDDGTLGWEYILVLYRIENSTQELLSFAHQHFELHVGESPRLVEKLLHLWEIHEQKKPFSKLQTEIKFREVLHHMLVSANSVGEKCDSQRLFEQVVHYIQDNYYQVITMDELIEQAKENRQKLTYVFEKYAGLAPMEYITHYRMKRAKEMLVTSSIPVQQIAYAIGFMDPFYFSRVFKKKVGCSPTHYRERTQKSMLI